MVVLVPEELPLGIAGKLVRGTLGERGTGLGDWGGRLAQLLCLPV